MQIIPSLYCHRILVNFIILISFTLISLELRNCNNIDFLCSISVLSPKVIGIAIARYDFCARDMRELSLFKGDVVKIYTKTSANGWWRGEANGRVGVPIFCHLHTSHAPFSYSLSHNMCDVIICFIGPTQNAWSFFAISNWMRVSVET